MILYTVDTGFLPLACISIASMVAHCAGNPPAVTILLHDVEPASRNSASRFLSGFGLSEITDLAQLSEDSRGYLRDLQEISRVDPEVAGKNDDEYSLMELCEYARMGALLLREETLFATVAPESSDTIH